jgi:hypothetical protein
MPSNTKKINMNIDNNTSGKFMNKSINVNQNNSNVGLRVNRNRNVFTNSMLGRIQHIKGSGCGSCGGAR